MIYANRKITISWDAKRSMTHVVIVKRKTETHGPLNDKSAMSCLPHLHWAMARGTRQNWDWTVTYDGWVNTIPMLVINEFQRRGPGQIVKIGPSRAHGGFK